MSRIEREAESRDGGVPIAGVGASYDDPRALGAVAVIDSLAELPAVLESIGRPV